MIKNHLHKIAIVSSLLLTSAQIASASESWPATDATGTQIAFYSDASGIVYHERLGSFFIVTNAGCVKQINKSGTELSNFCSNEWLDFEGITVADYDSNYLYLGLESPQKIYEFDILNNALTGKTWTLNGMSVATGAGLEALEYVAGYFYAGSQSNGKVYVYSVDLSASGSATLSSSFYPYSGYTTDLAALSYAGETDTLYSLYDGGNRLVLTKGDGTYINRYQLPSGTINEEGFVAVPNCPNSTTDIVITEDSGRIMRFSGFTIDTSRCTVTTPTVVDADADGVASTSDCNDNDATISSNRTYYRDADADGLGDPAVTTSVCSLTAPSGYVANASDLNDSDYDNDGVSTSSDCNDADSTISAYQTYYRDADGDGLGTSATTSVVCSYTVTSGYVTNSSNANDSDYDNDGVSTSADCNDNDATISAYQTYYRDADADGLGDPAVTTSVCSLTTPTGYVTNNLDTNDSGVVATPEPEPTPTYSDVEYLNNGIDDDGDGVIDEWNTLAAPGVHPVYGSYDPSSTSLYASTVTSIAGASNGAIKVKFIDGSGYRYTVFSVSTSRLTTVSSYNGTAYLLVKNASGRKTALVNAYTGAVSDTIATAKGSAISIHWKTLTLHHK